jgi:acylphosphatase
MAERSVRLTIIGRVQGVGYRAWVEREAARRGLAGWVRNRRDGSVEAVISATAGEVEAMIAACRRGPRLAEVVRIDIEDVAGPVGAGFSVLPTE